MANWCEGCLKIRGKADNLIAFIKNGIEDTSGGFESEKIHTIDEYANAVEYYFRSRYITGTSRMFVDWHTTSDGYIRLGTEDKQIICIHIKQAWNVRENELLDIAKKYNVDLKIFAYEKGCEFCRDIEIVNNEIIKNEEIKYKDYQWECSDPTLGG